MRTKLNLLLTIFIVTACSLDENSLRPEQQKPISFVDNQKIINEVVKLRNDLFGLPTKSLGDIEVTALMPISKSLNVIPYVVNYPDNGGFAVLAAHGENITILAITQSGNLPPEILQSALGNPHPAPFPIDSSGSDNDELLLDDSEDITYGDEHLDIPPLDTMPFIETENGLGMVLSPDHPAIGIITGSLGEVGWADDNIITNPNMPGIPTTPPAIDSTTIIDSSLIGIWLDGHGVRPLIQTKWNQTGVYQQACPIMPDGNYAYAGCVGIATAQIVAYLKPPTLPYNWDIISNFGTKDDVYGVSATESERSYIANYVRYVSDGVYTVYGSDGSSSNWPRVKLFLMSQITHENVYKHTATSRNESNFINRVQDRLKRRLPVYMQSANDTSAHAYIVDGYMVQRKYHTTSSYTTRKLFHINWGWGGNGDGYYYFPSYEGGKIAHDDNTDPGYGSNTQNYNQDIVILTYNTPQWMQ
ncbi:MAG: C10 family peptidase [Bacteroidales bacterium]|nr:C10 family peptidase [Bacteroidales bacterium]